MTEIGCLVTVPSKMATDFVSPVLPRPLRAILLGAATEGWFAASDEERRERVLPRFKEMLAEWAEMGTRCLATLDDDLMTVGEPGRLTSPGTCSSRSRTSRRSSQ